jgi:hypothetical protein
MLAAIHTSDIGVHQLGHRLYYNSYTVPDQDYNTRCVKIRISFILKTVPQAVNCRRSDVTAPGSSYPPLSSQASPRCVMAEPGIRVTRPAGEPEVAGSHGPWGRALSSVSWGCRGPGQSLGSHFARPGPGPGAALA